MKEYLFILSLLFCLVCLLLSVAYLTLLERHIIGLSQLRLGPNKSSFFGVLQAVFDGLKLLQKGQSLSSPLQSWFFISPLIIFGLLFFQWMVFPWGSAFFSFNNGLIMLISCVGALVYFFLFCGYFSVSKYALLGSLRAGSQSVSYELVFFVLLLGLSLFFKGLFFSTSGLLFAMLPIFFVFSLVVLIEVGRAPFDFPEAESELVSGYNVEFSSVSFVLLFLGEYGFVLFYSGLLSSILFESVLLSLYFLFLVLLLRSTFPRYRFDLLSGLFWFLLLPFSFYLVVFVYFIFVAL